MKILGLSFDYHDAAAAIVVDGECIAAAEEERFSRHKHDANYPKEAVGFCLDKAGLSPSELDAVVFYEKPLVKFDRIVTNSFRSLPAGFSYAFDTLDAWISGDKFDPFRRVIEDLGVHRRICHEVDHHKSHAASTYYASGWKDATIVTLDGVGEYETANIWSVRDGKMRKLRAMRFPHSLGLFYSAMTAFLGFAVNEGEYKVMGMAGFGSPNHLDAIRKIIKFDGKAIRTDLSYFNFRTPTETFSRQKLVDLLGAPRSPESPFRIKPLSDDPKESIIVESSRHYADIAASVQRVTEDLILDYVRFAIETTGINKVCMAGGVALNSLANGRITRELDCELYIQPAAGDGGGALGAAWAFWGDQNAGHRAGPLTHPYLGKQWPKEDIETAIEYGALENVEHYDDPDVYLNAVAECLAEGKVVGWYQGRFEWGPRALGARSIIAHPGIPGMQDNINKMIKFREPFRPFAPVVLEEYARDYFELPDQISKNAPERFMLSVCSVRQNKKSEIAAVTHVDGTARVQVVGPGSPAPYRRLLEVFYEKTGTPVLVNTSFNRRGEPMVASPIDAVRTYAWSGIDALAMGQYLAVKPQRFKETAWSAPV